MEEAESLASRIGIMAQGKMKCFGTLQQIQQAYGSGFEIEMNLRIDSIVHELEHLGEDVRMCFDLLMIQRKIQEWQQ